MYNQELIEWLLAEKALATNKDKMGALLDTAIERLKNIDAMPSDEKTASLINSFNEKIENKDSQIKQLTEDLSEAKEIAKDALSKFNQAALLIPKSLELEVSGRKVRVNFGVEFEGNNYTASELADRPGIVEKLLSIGSGSISILEDK